MRICWLLVVLVAAAVRLTISNDLLLRDSSDAYLQSVELSPLQVQTFQQGDQVYDFKLHSKISDLGYMYYHRFEEQYMQHQLSNGADDLTVVESIAPMTSVNYALNADTIESSSDLPILHHAYGASDSYYHSYYLKDNIFHGGHGEIWRAYKITTGFVDQSVTYILKRMSGYLRPDILLFTVILTWLWPGSSLTTWTAGTTG